MVTQEVTINNEVGLHARPATFFIQKANEFKSGIWVEKDERRVNAKSLLGVRKRGGRRTQRAGFRQLRRINDHSFKERRFRTGRSRLFPRKGGSA